MQLRRIMTDGGHDQHDPCPRARDEADSSGVKRCRGKNWGAPRPDRGGERSWIRHAADHVADDLQRFVRTGIWCRLRRGFRCSVVAAGQPGNARVARRRCRGHGRSQPGLIHWLGEWRTAAPHRLLQLSAKRRAAAGNIVIAETREWIMYDAPAGSDVCAGVDVKIVIPDDGIIRIESTRLFADSDGSPCRRFVGRVFLATEIESVVIVSAMAER